MTLRKQALGSVLATTIVLILVVYTFSRLIILRGFSDLEAQQVRKSVERVLESISHETDALAATAAHWAVMRETRAFIRDGDKSFVSRNLQDSTFIALRLNALVFLDAEGRTVFGKAFDLRTNKEATLPPDLIRLISGEARKTRRRPCKLRPVAGVVLLPNDPMLVASCPVENGSCIGTVIMGRYLDAGELERLGEGLRFTSVTVGRSDFPSMLNEMCGGLSVESPVCVRVRSRDYIAGFVLITDIRSKPVLILSLDVPRAIYRRGKATTNYFLFSLLGAGLIFAAMVMLILDRRIVSRLTDLGRGVGKIAAGGEPSLRVTVTGNDELTDLAKQINGMLEALLDSEKALRASELRYRAVVEDQTELICRFLPNGTLTFVNQACCSYVGETCETLMGRNFFELFRKQDKEDVASHLAAFVPENPVVVDDERVASPGGDLRWYQWTERAVFDEQGSLLEFQAVGLDITERKRMEQELRKAHDELERRVRERTAELSRTNEQLRQEINQRKAAEENLRRSEERYRAVVEDQTELICRFLPDWTLTFANSAYCRYYGKQLEELLGKSLFHVMPEEESERTIQHLAHLNPLAPVSVSEHQVIAANGQIRWQQWTDRAIFDDRGELLEYQSVARDVTELKKAEERLRESLMEKEVLLREIHHRVKNNLQVMASLLNLQSDAVKDDKHLNIFKDAESRIWSMALVHETLYQSKSLALIKVKEYMESLVDELFSSYGDLGGRVHINIDVADVSFGIDTAVPLGLIVNELVSNAFKHAFPQHKQGLIRVGFRRVNDNEYELSVSDDGVGMSSTGEPDRETSFGLHLVKALVRQLSGELEMRGNNGTQFVITFKETDRHSTR